MWRDKLLDHKLEGESNTNSSSVIVLLAWTIQTHQLHPEMLFFSFMRLVPQNAR